VVTIISAAIFVLIVIGLAAYMLAQKPVTTAQQLIQQNRYEEAARHPSVDPMHRAEALKLSGKFEEAIASYRESDDPAAKEGIALSLAHLGRNLDDARSLMENYIALHPQIQEFQALGLAYILLKAGRRDDALRLYRDNVELLETRFKDDYTDRDPLLAETLFMYGALADANGEDGSALRAKAAQWAPGSVWALNSPNSLN
jgi:tetratricopeptide (TPR) repeat protein